MRLLRRFRSRVVAQLIELISRERERAKREERERDLDIALINDCEFHTYCCTSYAAGRRLWTHSLLTLVVSPLLQP